MSNRIAGLRYSRDILEINMTNNNNPFHELYVTESFGPDSFVKLFSDVLVDHASALFKPGNIILKGLPGTGKTMMLSLLKPSIRIAYKQSNVDFPVPDRFARFVGAGINLIRSNVADFGQRPIRDKSEINELAVYFGDFVNYWVVRDILSSIHELNELFSEEIGIDLSADKLASFVADLKNEDCWFNYLDDVHDYEQLLKKIKDRIVSYRSYLHFNIDSIPEDIISTKTSIGIPISKMVALLRKHNILKKNVEVYIRIDQYEELSWLDRSVPGLGMAFKSIINKLLSLRDSSVSYRVGTRPFAWSENSQEIFGTSARLELLRNYNEISIDEALRRPENGTYLFPKFAEDIFERRLRQANYDLPRTKSALGEVFGSGMNAHEKAIRYVPNSRSKAVVLDPEWPEEWKNVLLQLAQESPLSARFGEAWARQKGKQSIVNNIPVSFPWDTEGKKYWRKERTQQALLQIASRNNQQLIWEGRSDILELSGGSILVFLNICQQIWEVWMRDPSNKPSFTQLPKISFSVQTLGILHTSSSWFDNLSGMHGAKERKKFISYIGVLFHKLLVEDLSMSYPGHNGFSLENEDQAKFKELESFLKEASDYGDLEDRPHTTKSSDKKKRTKWYLHPILSPYFKIPTIHTKEPKYVKGMEVLKWYHESLGIDEMKDLPSLKRNLKDNDSDSTASQTSLF